MDLFRRLSRRSFVLKVSAALLAFIPAATGLARGAEGDSNPVGPSPTPNPQPPSPGQEPPPGPRTQAPARSVNGIAIEVSQGELLIESRKYGPTRVLLSPTTPIWKGGWGSGRPIEVGDKVSVRGTDEIAERSGEVVVEAEKIWVNIVNLFGPISEISSTADGIQFTLEDRHGRVVSIEIDAATQDATGPGGEVPYLGSGASLADSQVIQVIGLDRGDGTILATRVFLD